METISVKVYSLENNDIRRFPFKVPKEGTDPRSYEGIYGCLMRKVKEFYAPSSEWTLQLAWKDEEGDTIAMNTDDEVVEAARNMKDKIFRIYVRRVAAKGSDRPAETKETEVIKVNIGENGIPVEETKVEAPKSESQPEQEQKQESNDGRTHTGIICDGCNNETIEGVRFKCLMCRDYDLCAVCEGKHVHDQHPMIRIVDARDHSWQPAFMAAQGLFGHGMRLRHGFGRCPHRLVYPGHQNANNSTGQKNDGNSTTGGQQPGQQPTPEFPGIHFLRDVGQTVAAVLNGFGVDVDIDVEHGGQRSKVATPNTAEPKKGDAGEGATEKQNATNEKQQTPEPTAPAVEQLVDVSSPPTAGNVESNVQITPDGQQQEWMILDKAEATGQETQGPTAPKATGGPTMEPRIEAALNHMLSMGYTNEGGWLSQLLQAKQGDIAAVLDILHPTGGQKQ